MGNKMLIDASHPEETRVVVARGSRIEEFDFESASRKPLKGNIYLAKVTRVEPSLQAAFIEYGGNRHGFLAFAEIHPDYYQIPVADRLELLRQQEEDDAEDAEDENGADAHHAEDDDADEQENPETSDHEEQGENHPETDHDEAEDHVSAQPLRAGESDSVTSDVVEADAAQDGEQESHTEAEQADSAPVETTGDIVAIEEDAEARKVESIGAEDILEEMPQRRQRRQPRRRTYKIQEVIKRRQILLVQVVKEERGNKGAALTTYLSLAGRYCVLMPNTARGGGISRKITDAGDRRRLKEVARDVEVPQGMGLIVRTAGAQRTRPEIKRDFDYLIRLWESVRDLTLQSQAPCLVYEEGSLIKRSIRDLYTKDVDEVIVEGDEAYREAKDFMKMLMPSHAKNVKPYKDNRPLFSRYQVESHLDGLLSPTVTLPSGGYLVINQTEALVSIDINSGKATREHSIEDTAVKTNLEACDEIARQLRLRDLAGLIVIDYIDMEENRNNRAVERRIKDALKNDRARIQVGRISHFGLLEMSRQRLRPGILEGTFRSCPHCEGKGIVRSVSSCGLGVLRSIEDHLLKRQENLTVRCARDVAFYLLNEKRDSVLELEQTHGITVFIVPGGEELKGTQANIEKAHDRDIAPRRAPAAAPVRMDSAYEDEPVTEEIEAEAEIETDSERDGETRERTSERGDDGQPRDGRRRRRRGRRGGRNTELEGSALPQTGVSNESDDAEAGGSGSDSDPEVIELSADDGVSEARAGNDVPAAERDSGEADTETVSRAPDEQRDAGDERGGRNGRRGRFGRGRRSERDTGKRGEAAPSGGESHERQDREGSGNRPRHDRPRRDGQHSDGPRKDFGGPSLVAPPPGPKIEIPEFIPEPEPRKWQPPQSTVPTEASTRKAGWWNKRDT